MTNINLTDSLEAVNSNVVDFEMEEEGKDYSLLIDCSEAATQIILDLNKQVERHFKVESLADTAVHISVSMRAQYDLLCCLQEQLQMAQEINDRVTQLAVNLKKKLDSLI